MHAHGRRSQLSDESSVKSISCRERQQFSNPTQRRLLSTGHNVLSHYESKKVQLSCAWSQFHEKLPVPSRY
ncbi:hypothetical protein Y032_0070g445 [Ancylostoma ceylanicum]|uniref:Uncharacterized protein n=1 Tax=Ancylostoma ceylanicum TaxID=53326 RepID=A0A016TXF8_9BILA|nr:hypothetical protein Y032_0070g445 [Ancylostoma ceylanicum]